MISVRVSTLESFRRVADTSYGDEHELVEYVRHGQTSEPNWMMAAGTAWHRALAGESPDFLDIETGHWHYGDWLFRNDDVTDAREHVGPGLCEVTARRVFRTPVGNVEVRGTCDRIRGLYVRDAKAKFTTPDAKDYEPSLQWRFYLLLHGAARFTYDLFAFRDPGDKQLCELRGIESFNFWRYSGLEWECQSWLVRFVEWADSRNLLGFLAAREGVAA